MATMTASTVLRSRWARSLSLIISFSACFCSVSSLCAPSMRMGLPLSSLTTTPRQRTHTVDPFLCRYRTIWSYGWFGSAQCFSKFSRATCKSSGWIKSCHSDVRCFLSSGLYPKVIQNWGLIHSFSMFSRSQYHIPSNDPLCRNSNIDESFLNKSYSSFLR